MYSEEKTIDKIEIEMDGTMFIQEITKVLKDGIVISENYHRTSYRPDEELISLPQNIINIANIVRTKEKIDLYKAKVEEMRQNIK